MKKFKFSAFSRLLKKATAIFTSVALLSAIFIPPPIVSAANPATGNWQDAENVASGYAGGNGTANNPYLISTEGQLAYLAKKVNSGANYDNTFFLLESDLDLSAHMWTPIGLYNTGSNFFSGNFDGGGHTITGLTIGSESDPSGFAYDGLFGYFFADLNSGISNLSLHNVSIYARQNSGSSYYTHLGSFMGGSGGSNGGMVNCHADGQLTVVQGSNFHIGGLIGESCTYINNCSSSVAVNGDKGETGGLVGYNAAPIVNCASTGSVNGGIHNIDNSEAGYHIGGIAGYNSSSVANSYFTGSFSFTGYGYMNDLGEICGGNAIGASITNCYAAAGSVTPTGNTVGGIVGSGTFGNCTNDYWCNDYPSGAVTSGESFGVNGASEFGMSAAAMQNPSFATALTGNASGQSGWYGWTPDMLNVNGGYPVLAVPNSDAALSGLTVDGATLTPVFDSYTTSYSASVADTVGSVSVKPLLNDSNATATVNGAGLTGGVKTVNLAFGLNTIYIKVIAQNGSSTRIYTLNVTRSVSNDANLSNLVVSSGGTPETLSPDFSPMTASYSVSVPTTVSSVTVTPTLSYPGTTPDTGARVTVNGAQVASGSTSGSIALTAGQTKEIDVIVTAEDGSVKPYTINVTRAAPENPALKSLGLSAGTLSDPISEDEHRYTLTMPQSASSVVLSPIAENSGSIITVDGKTLVNGTATVSLTPGTAQDILIEVDASDGSGYPNSYIIHVTWWRPSWQDSGFAATAFGGGDGSAAHTYLIANAGELAYLAQQVNGGASYFGAYFTLTADIDLSGRDWVPIGSMFKGFCGTFDGAGHKITGLSIGTPTDYSDCAAGLFGVVGDIFSDSPKGAVKNTSVAVTEYIYGNESGGIAAVNAGTIDNCSASGNISNSYDYTDASGGIAGYNGAVISNSHSSVTIKGDHCNYVGGISGHNYGTINGCYSTGTINGRSNVGGISGENDSEILNSYSRGTLNCGDSGNVGGIAGGNESNITNCYSASNISGGDYTDSSDGTYIGGISGYNCGKLINSYAVGNLVSTATSSLGGVTGSNGGTITNGYWSLAATQKQGAAVLTAAQLKGVGDGEGSGTLGMSVADMTNTKAATTFVRTLNTNRTTNGIPWKYVEGSNSGFPVLDGVGEGINSTATLSSLQVGSGTLSPAFSSNQTSYSVAVNYSLTGITVTPVASDGGEKIQVNGNDVESGNTASVALTPDAAATIQIIVTAQDGVTTKTYTVNVIRVPADAGVAVSPSSSSVIQGQSLSFSASVSVSGNTPQSVVWAVLGNHSNETAIDGNGRLTVAADETAAVLTIKATSTANAELYGTAMVFVLPAVISSGSTGVTLDLSGATLPSGVTSVSLESCTLPQSTDTGSVYSAVASLIGADGSLGRLDGLTVYDLKLLNQNGDPVENFTGRIKVKLPIPNNLSGDLHVFWYNPDSHSLTDMNATEENGYLVFETTHFSDYAIAQLSPQTPGTIPNPETGNGSTPILPIALIGAASTAGLIILKKSMKWKVKKNPR